MIAVVIILVVTTLMYLLAYKRYRRKVVDFILRTRCLENTFEQVEAAMEDNECEEVEVYCHFYKFKVNKKNRREYYQSLLQEVEKLEGIYEEITCDMFFGIDDELWLLLSQLRSNFKNVHSMVRSKMWLCGC